MHERVYADELHTDVPSKLWFEPYIDMTVNEIVIYDPDYCAQHSMSSSSLKYVLWLYDSALETSFDR